eukprot:CAMPEP_0117697038 /NCGR_PEP_ID=MMETSP0804-20121206/29006_1 /TAXON_ID=1074897 /ORGANISM="Tetraselmis astigmatica, Strain CCMP880" /LENGTH=247 /DNA_ID=CAMNT_0005511243 /DNA_START=322 /DNA_END=1065 /DNA_ORIENTATION=-
MSFTQCDVEVENERSPSKSETSATAMPRTLSFEYLVPEDEPQDGCASEGSEMLQKIAELQAEVSMQQHELMKNKATEAGLRRDLQRLQTQCAQLTSNACTKGSEMLQKIAELQAEVSMQQHELMKNKATEAGLRRDLQRLQTQCAQLTKERDMTYMGWRKAKIEGTALAEELANIKAQQHKMQMRADNKVNSLQCKIDSLEYAARETERKHHLLVESLTGNLKLETPVVPTQPEVDLPGPAKEAVAV